MGTVWGHGRVAAAPDLFWLWSLPGFLSSLLHVPAGLQRLPHHSFLARGITGALEMPLHTNSWPQTTVVPVAMGHSCPVPPEGLGNRERQVQPH